MQYSIIFFKNSYLRRPLCLNAHAMHKPSIPVFYIPPTPPHSSSPRPSTLWDSSCHTQTGVKRHKNLEVWKPLCGNLQWIKLENPHEWVIAIFRSYWLMLYSHDVKKIHFFLMIYILFMPKCDSHLFFFQVSRLLSSWMKKLIFPMLIPKLMFNTHSRNLGAFFCSIINSTGEVREVISGRDVCASS